MVGLAVTLHQCAPYVLFLSTVRAYCLQRRNELGCSRECQFQLLANFNTCKTTKANDDLNATPLQPHSGSPAQGELLLRVLVPLLVIVKPVLLVDEVLQQISRGTAGREAGRRGVSARTAERCLRVSESVRVCVCVVERAQATTAARSRNNNSNCIGNLP